MAPVSVTIPARRPTLDGMAQSCPRFITICRYLVFTSRSNYLLMKKDSGGNRHRLMTSACAWALLVDLLIAAATGWAGFDTTEVLETGAFGAFGAAICILFFAGDILAVADHLSKRGRRP
ncbi:MAG: hypothetical protein WB611_11575 [Stellaceae bacterium]